MAEFVYRSRLTGLCIYFIKRRQCIVRSLSSTSRDVESVKDVRGVERDGDTFSSRLLSLLRGGEVEGEKRREGVGGVSGRQMAAARVGLLEALQSTEAQPLSPEKSVSVLCQHYQGLRGDMERRLALIAVLSLDLAVNHSTIQNSAKKLTQLHSEGRPEATLLKSESHLRQALTPFYTELFTHISRMEGGIKFLVDLRADILEQLQSHSDHTSLFLFSEMSTQLRGLLSQWFSSGLLDIQQLTWESPCDIMEKVGNYEAVHPVRHWLDMKHRVGTHRRCFIFTHRSLPRDPLTVLHVALTSEPPSNIQTLLNRSLQGGDIRDVNTAVFYSISATQKGLSGINLGYFIIRRVVDELLKEFPQQLKTFVTLSPIPGFRRWLDSRVKQILSAASHGQEEPPLHVGVDMSELRHFFPDASCPTQALQMALATRDWAVDREGPLAAALKGPLSSLCAWYLVNEKRRARALNSVANFHLSGGASIWRLNWLADTSPLGFQNSYGMMCNYHYSLPALTANSDSYRMTGSMAMSDSVQALLEQQD